ncbi:MAG TPA: DUF4440 domain-containing protein [Longimicrobiaceae bacterium]|jgi:steroid delta-isomerase
MRPRIAVRLPAAFFLLLVLAGPARAQQPAAGTVTSGPERDVAAIRAAVVHSGEAANAGDPEEVMALYARDIVLSYPGVPDMDYAALERGYREMLRTPGVTLRTAPEIHEIMVSGDLAVVRVTWTTTVTTAAPGQPAKSASRLARDLQVWRREADGSWKFARGMHYRVPLPEAADPAGRRPGR